MNSPGLLKAYQKTLINSVSIFKYWKWIAIQSNIKLDGEILELSTDTLDDYLEKFRNAIKIYELKAPEIFVIVDKVSKTTLPLQVQTLLANISASWCLLWKM